MSSTRMDMLAKRTTHSDPSPRHQNRAPLGAPWRLMLYSGLSSFVVLILLGCGKRPATTTLTTKPGSLTSSPAQAVNDYLGDAACAECHQEITTQYAGHSMGQSLREVADLPADSSLLAAIPHQFEAGGFRYSVRREADRLIHRQARVAADGSEVAVIEEPIRFVVGSGNHGQSFLVEREARIFMSPLTWYPRTQIWDLSPGYEKNNSEFNRPVVEQCLFCHSNEAHVTKPTLNRYATPIFRGHAIGCERCHGPGQRHVQLHRQGTTEVDEIVNPAKLEPHLREAVCQQCHLSGVARVLKPGKQLYDFRPGQPLDGCFEIFVLNKPDQEARFVGHVEQMHASQCFQQSDGKLGCISCHDPHQLPPPEEKVNFYRDRCLACHTVASCGVAEADRLKESPADNCQQCHMPAQTTEVHHTATTDHRIVRNRASTPHNIMVASSDPILAFPTNEATPRDHAIGLVMAADADADADAVRSRHLKAAATTLQHVTSRNPDDIEAMVALSNLYMRSGRLEDATATCRLILERQPNREETLVTTAEIFAAQNDHTSAMQFWRRAMDVNPWMARYWHGLARAQAATGMWSACRKTSEEAKRRFPTSIGARQLLVESQLQLGDVAAAEQEFAELVAYQPRGMEKLRRWYESHPRRAAPGPAR